MGGVADLLGRARSATGLDYFGEDSFLEGLEILVDSATREARFTEMGRDLYKPMIVMMRWGDRWLSGGQPPLRLRHRICGADFEPLVVCDHCRQEIVASETDYELTYTLPD